ncbi:MAG: hypothetical protein PVG11_10465 [Anaerolineae bacterium]|jgi:hypothetical protein
MSSHHPIRYNPLVPPDPEAWLAAEELDRHLAVQAYHQRAHVELPAEELHAAIHTTVENQAALGGETPVPGVLERLMTEGLDRHEAIHAIGSVLIEHIWMLLQEDVPDSPDLHAPYYQALRELTAQKWLDMADEVED